MPSLLPSNYTNEIEVAKGTGVTCRKCQITQNWFFFFLNKILTVTCALLGISSKEAQFVEKKKKGITKWTDWDGRERKETGACYNPGHASISRSSKWLYPTRSQFNGKRFHILLRSSMAALHLNLHIFQLLLVFSCSTPTAKLNQSLCHS